MTCNWLVRGSIACAVLIVSISAYAAWPALRDPEVLAPGAGTIPANEDCTAFARDGGKRYSRQDEAANSEWWASLQPLPAARHG